MGGSNQQVQKATLPTAADYKANRMAAPSAGSERAARQNYAANLMSEGQFYGKPEADKRSEALMRLAQEALGTSATDRFSRAITSQRQSSAASQWNAMQSQSEREQNGFTFSPDNPENYQVAADNNEAAGSAAMGAGTDILSAAIPAAMSMMSGSGGGSGGLGGLLGGGKDVATGAGAAKAASGTAAGGGMTGAMKSLGGGGGNIASGAMGAIVPMALKSLGGVKTGTPWIDRTLKGISIGGSEGWTGGSFGGPTGSAYGALFGSIFGGLDGAVDGPIYKAKTGGSSGFGKGFDQTMSGLTQMTA
jgi:hypothetical protein